MNSGGSSTAWKSVEQYDANILVEWYNPNKIAIIIKSNIHILLQCLLMHVSVYMYVLYKAVCICAGEHVCACESAAVSTCACV